MDQPQGGLFIRDGHRFVPQPIAAGPWDPGALHGGPPASLVGRLILDHEPGDASWFLARLSVELVRPVPMAPLEVAITVRRPGRRVQLLDAVVTAPDGTEVLWARGLRLVQQDNGLDESQVPQPQREPTPPPGSYPIWTSELALPWPAFSGAYEMRIVHGTPFSEPGPAAVWSRLLLPLIDGEPIHPLDRVITLADFPNGFGNAVPFEQYVYINPDLTVSLHRLPAGEWVLLDAHMYARSTGHGSSVGVLVDELGPIGTASQSLLITAR